MPFIGLSTRTASIRTALKMPASDPTEGQIPVWRGGVYAFEAKPAGDGGGGGGGAWGEITGTLASQTDLQTALNAKLDTSSASLVATTGLYADLAGKPTLGTASGRDEGFFALAAQGAKADTAVQPAAIISGDAGNTLVAGVKLWAGSQVAYDAIASPDANTVYIING